MLDKQRNRTTSYCVKVNNDNTLSCAVTSVTTYPQGQHNTVTGTFRYDALPKWMIDSMKMLDAAAVDGGADIPDFGQLHRDVYWFMADQTK